MADNCDDYSKEQLLRLLRERDRRPNFGLVNRFAAGTGASAVQKPSHGGV